MRHLILFKNLYLNYLAVIGLSFILIFFTSNYELDIALNFLENCLFAFVLVCTSFLIKNTKFRTYYGLLVYIGFGFTIIIETIYFSLFKVFVSSSTLYLVFDSNSKESAEFFQSYVGSFEVFSILTFLGVLVFFSRKLIYQYRIFVPYSNRWSLKMFLLIGLTLGYLKFSTHIIYNFPYLFIKSFREYSAISKGFDEYANHQNDNFETDGLLVDIKDRDVFVLILGESTVRSHMELYGYYRSTTPNLQSLSEELWIYNDVISSNAHTIESLTKMLTLGNYENPDNIWNGSIIQLANKAGYKTFWLSNQRPIGIYESLITKIARSASEVKFMTTMHGRHNRVLDQSLITELDKILESSKDKPKFIVIHLAGTHMFYKNRYPENKQIFKNTPNIKYKSKSNFETVNHYDNAVLYNDYIIYNIINRVKQLYTKSAVMYLSDHGEELFQDKDFAGHNEDVATKSMYEIPFFLWQSEKYKNDVNLIYDPNRSYMADDFFHSMADLLQIKSRTVDSTRSIFSNYFQKRQRFLSNDRNYDILFNPKP